MALNPETFAYLKPTDFQLTVMDGLRKEFAHFAHRLNIALPEGPDKTYILRKLRSIAMWANVAVTRHPDGSPRTQTDEITP